MRKCSKCGKAVDREGAFCICCLEDIRLHRQQLKAQGLCQNGCGPTDGKSVRCDDCKKHNREVTAKYHKELRHDVIVAYGGKCICCSESTFEFLAIDHVNGGGEQQRKQDIIGSKFYKQLKEAHYPSEYRLLCNNCNYGIFRNHGFCPGDPFSHKLTKITHDLPLQGCPI